MTSMDAKFAAMNDLVTTFGGQVQEAFQHVAAVEASFQIRKALPYRTASVSSRRRAR